MSSGEWDCGRIVDASSNPEALAALLENHRAFLRYLERQVGERALAENILQDAFAKVVARCLRNAAIDQVRRRRPDERALQAFARELATQDAPPQRWKPRSAPASGVWRQR